MNSNNGPNNGIYRGTVKNFLKKETESDPQPLNSNKSNAPAASAASAAPAAPAASAAPAAPAIQRVSSRMNGGKRNRKTKRRQRSSRR